MTSKKFIPTVIIILIVWTALIIFLTLTFVKYLNTNNDTEKLKTTVFEAIDKKTGGKWDKKIEINKFDESKRGAVLCSLFATAVAPLMQQG